MSLWSALVRRHRFFAGWCGGILLGVSAMPAAAHTAEEVQALVERAAAHVQQVGREQAFVDFTRHDGGFVEGELYVFCDSTDGKVLAHGDNPKLVGKSLTAVRDSQGMSPTVELIRVAQTQGHGWVDYFWPNPKTLRVQRKNTYVVRIDNQTICASGYYLPEPP